MTKPIHIRKLLLIASLGSLALTACVPGQYAYDSTQSGAEYGQYGAEYGQYGAQSGQYSAQYGGGFAQTRYGAGFSQTSSASLRPACNAQAAPCGYMTVLPVYPIYQVAAPQPDPVVEIYEPPVVETYEPEPTIIYEPEPEPVFTPIDHWPEPAAPVQSWKPIRK